jgi:hypothetical protein
MIGSMYGKRTTGMLKADLIRPFRMRLLSSGMCHLRVNIVCRFGL